MLHSNSKPTIGRITQNSNPRKVTTTPTKTDGDYPPIDPPNKTYAPSDESGRGKFKPEYVKYDNRDYNSTVNETPQYEKLNPLVEGKVGEEIRHRPITNSPGYDFVPSQQAIALKVLNDGSTVEVVENYGVGGNGSNIVPSLRTAPIYSVGVQPQPPVSRVPPGNHSFAPIFYLPLMGALRLSRLTGRG